MIIKIIKINNLHVKVSRKLPFGRFTLSFVERHYILFIPEECISRSYCSLPFHVFSHIGCTVYSHCNLVAHTRCISLIHAVLQAHCTVVGSDWQCLHLSCPQIFDAFPILLCHHHKQHYWLQNLSVQLHFKPCRSTEWMDGARTQRSIYNSVTVGFARNSNYGFLFSHLISKKLVPFPIFIHF